MSLKICNTLTRKKEIFKPRKDKKVNIFVCGPTVYDYAHIGHARTYIAFDVIVKYLRKKGYNVFYLQNITDIDDKIINRAKEEEVSWKELARSFEREYKKDVKNLGINSISKYARATEHIKEIISQVERLLKKGFAYQIEDGIYYDISKFKDYGKLSGRTALQAEDAVSRIDNSKKKKNKGDFCLWKFWSGKDWEPKWRSPWGYGRPGWHIEDTAITEKYFGPQYDIHGGARDLIFPHHEAEIAQMEAISGKKPLVKYWLHTGFLTINGQKMSKSLGNFITVKDFLKKYSPRILRLFIIKTHYRSPIDYSEKAISQVQNEIERIDEFLEKVKSQKSKVKITTKNSKLRIQKFKKEFEGAMEDDFNTPKAMAIIFELIREVNPLLDQGTIDKRAIKEILEFLKSVDEIFGFIFEQKKAKIPKKIKKLAQRRAKLRKEKKWKEADRVREEIKKLGYEIQDTPLGTKIKKL
ncbi:cysteine--tRNA ligase [bacterium]|nr:cysteine--tRNA ligase [bacterium]